MTAQHLAGLGRANHCALHKFAERRRDPANSPIRVRAQPFSRCRVIARYLSVVTRVPGLSDRWIVAGFCGWASRSPIRERRAYEIRPLAAVRQHDQFCRQRHCRRLQKFPKSPRHRRARLFSRGRRDSTKAARLYGQRP